MLRIGHAPRGRISYFSPQTTIEEFLRHAAEHEGRLLFVGNFKSLRNKIGFNYLLLWSPQVVPEFLRTLVFARPRGDDQFADCTFSPSLDMSR